MAPCDYTAGTRPSLTLQQRSACDSRRVSARSMISQPPRGPLALDQAGKHTGQRSRVRVPPRRLLREDLHIGCALCPLVPPGGPMPTEEFGPYLLQELIGRGGMGEVWRAYDTVKERKVALKRLPVHLADDAHFQDRFRRESKIIAKLDEPHVIPIYDFGEINGRLFLTMRLVKGRDLARLIEEVGPLPQGQAVAIIRQVASALAAAHSEGLIHRDVKPSNILIGETATGEAFVYLVDFGIARTSAGTALTTAGATIGTLEYMAPERLTEGTCDHRSDIYSLGCLLYECLTSKKPFSATELPALMYAHVHTPPPSAARLRPGLEDGLDHVISTAMAKDPEQRYQGAAQLAEAARTALNHGEPRSDIDVNVTTKAPETIVRRPVHWSDKAAISSPRSFLETERVGVKQVGRDSEPTESSSSGRRKKSILAGLGIVAAAVLLLVFTMNPPSYGTIAYSDSSQRGSFGFGVDQRRAENAAIANCSAVANAGDDCRPFIWFTNAWGSLAQATGGYAGFGWAYTRGDAEGNAIEHCRQAGGVDCRIVITDTTDTHPN